ncbi:39S ribosomal protein L40, mitochondrial [Episyrphus balteatus]|uniref:39S ribosomal protein L40, mitochondrial n=1 Tax=Episyrphus balteatus TaxID=286459 RepID=UPI002485A0AA|nr:39S ribosomal protein L40, mitochondrial [Episyrphus balteatus]
MFLNSLFQRLPIRDILSRSINTASVLNIHATPALCAEPLKKKRKIDPQIIKQREDRKKKKIEKQIRRLEKNARQLKPIEELDIPIELIDEKSQRARAITIAPEVLEQRVSLNKQWAAYKHKEKVADFQIIDRVLQSQMKALDELRKESEELYLEAIQPDNQLLPISIKGPVATPPIENYPSPDGEYIHLTKNWE